VPDSLVQRAAAPAARRRPVRGGELGLGLLVTGGAVLASALVSAKHSPSPLQPGLWVRYKVLRKPSYTAPDWAFGGVWPPLCLLLTLSGLRVWNAPRGGAQTRALAHWFGAQGLNALRLWLGFRRRERGAMTAEAVATLANAAAYVDAARRVDRPAAATALPCAAWIGFAALLSEELWRRNR